MQRNWLNSHPICLINEKNLLKKGKSLFLLELLQNSFLLNDLNLKIKNRLENLNEKDQNDIVTSENDILKQNLGIKLSLNH